MLGGRCKTLTPKSESNNMTGGYYTDEMLQEEKENRKRLILEYKKMSKIDIINEMLDEYGSDSLSEEEREILNQY